MPANDKPPTELDSREAEPTPAGDVVMIYATFPSADLALAAGRALVEDRLAGCVNILPKMTSVYVWKGSTETADEAVMIAKLAREASERAVAQILAKHPYETPAIVVLPVVGGSADYLAWVRSGTRL